MLNMVNTYIPKLTSLQEGILRFLFSYAGKEFTARAIAINLDVSPPAISKALPNMIKENFLIVKKDKENKRLSIRLNREDPKIWKIKRVDNLRQIYESGLASFLEDSFPEALIILFGSYSYGEDIYSSDIDIAIIGAKEKVLNLEKFQKTFAKEININFYDTLNQIDKNLRSNILNGIVLSGRISL